MAEKDDGLNLNEKLSSLLISNPKTSNDDSIKFDDLVPVSTSLGCSFACSSSLQDLVYQGMSQTFFQKLLAIVENELNIDNFHMRLVNRYKHGFTIHFQYKNCNEQRGPVLPDTCFSCDMNNELSQFSLIKQNSTTCIWLDAQLRQKLIVTPRRHIERLTEMSQDEMTQFWHDTQVQLDEENCTWISMTINHGKYRTHPHLHMKITIDEQQWNKRIQKKYEHKLKQIEDLLERNENDVIRKNFGDRKFVPGTKIEKFSAKQN